MPIPMSLEQLAGRVGAEVAVSDWIAVSQPMIDEFADAIADRQWIHVDPERAARESPFRDASGQRRTVAHGFLTLSLLTAMMGELIDIGGANHFVNYGLDRVRFTGIVRAGDRVRLQQTLAAADPVKGGVRLTMTSTMQIEGSERPALVADFIFLAFTATD